MVRNPVARRNVVKIRPVPEAVNAGSNQRKLNEAPPLQKKKRRVLTERNHRLTICFHFIVCTSSSWLRCASLPRDLIFFGSSFWYLRTENVTGMVSRAVKGTEDHGFIYIDGIDDYVTSGRGKKKKKERIEIAEYWLKMQPQEEAVFHLLTRSRGLADIVDGTRAKSRTRTPDWISRYPVEISSFPPLCFYIFFPKMSPLRPTNWQSLFLFILFLLTRLIRLSLIFISSRANLIWRSNSINRGEGNYNSS